MSIELKTAITEAKEIRPGVFMGEIVPGDPEQPVFDGEVTELIINQFPAPARTIIERTISKINTSQLQTK